MKMRNIWKSGLSIVLSSAMILGCGGGFPAAAAEPSASGAAVQILGLKTNGLVNPLGIDSETPVFNWKMMADRTGAKQTSYQIAVRDMNGNLMWDSGEVISSDSTEIPYEGEGLKPQTKYQWQVKVKDEQGNIWTSEENTFETALMDTTLASWDGAKWIGPDEYSLDAASAAVFDMSMTMQLSEKSPKAGIILGGGDFRLANKAYNIWGSETDQSYYEVEIDVTDPEKAVMNLYAVGMPTANQKTENKPSEPDYTYDISEILTKADAYKPIRIRVETVENGTSNLHIQVNGKDAIQEKKSGWGGVTIQNYVTMNPLGSDISYNSFPNLNQIGFAVPAGSQVEYSDIMVINPGAFSDPVELFSATDGATYEIFKGLENVEVNGETVTAGGGEPVLAFADPSYGSAPIVRTDFGLKSGEEIASARLYVSAQGLYEMYINGEAVTDSWFNPGDEEYRERMPYQTYDVTELLNNGENAMGAQLTEGWWSGQTSYYTYNYNFYGSRQALLAKLDVTYADGAKETIVTDPETWECSTKGPVEFASFYHGQRYNAEKEAAVEGWATTACDTSSGSWKKAAEILQKYDYEMVTREDVPAHLVNIIEAQDALGEAMDGSKTYIYDMGENIVGVPRIKIPAEYLEKGGTVTVRFAEILYPDLDEYVQQGINGTMMVENLRAALCTDFYTPGAGDLTIEPHFTFHGYRYIEIGGLKKELPRENIQTLVISSVDNTAAYDSSNELVSRLFKNVQNSQTSNFLSIPTDCPQRNERLGWTGDAQVFSVAATYNADVYNLYRNWMHSLRAEQGKDGSLPTYAPCYGEYGNSTSGWLKGISWEGSIALIPYNLYKQTGNPAIIKDNMDAMLKYMDFLNSSLMKDKQYLTSQTGILADWLSVDSTDAAMVNNCVYIYMMDIISQMAVLIGRDDVAKAMAEKYVGAKAEWNATYVDMETGKTQNDTETSYATPLRYGIFADEVEQKAVENYVKTVKKANYTITSGFSGTPNLVPVLTQYGYVDEAYKLFEQTEYASWLYPVTQGATSVWERWDSYTVEGGFNGNNSMNSFNHFSLGAISEWMMSTQLGITTARDKAGYQNFVLQPTAGGTFDYANGSFESEYGTIFSGWTTKDGEIATYQASVPANTEALLYLQITEKQAECLELPSGASFVGMEVHNGVECAKFQLLSGSYDFSITNAVDAAGIAADKAQAAADEARKEAEEAKKAAEAADRKAEEAKKESGESSAAAKAAMEAAKRAEETAREAQLKADRLEFAAKKMTIKKAGSTKKKFVKLTWKKVSGANGYVIQYSTKPGFSKGKKLTIKKGSVAVKTIKKLRRGKKYYFRIRAYKTIGGKKVYTDYSGRKTVSVK